jgi:hypothetical protein
MTVERDQYCPVFSFYQIGLEKRPYYQAADPLLPSLPFVDSKWYLEHILAVPVLAIYLMFALISSHESATSLRACDRNSSAMYTVVRCFSTYTGQRVNPGYNWVLLETYETILPWNVSHSTNHRNCRVLHSWNASHFPNVHFVVVAADTKRAAFQQL